MDRRAQPQEIPPLEPQGRYGRRLNWPRSRGVSVGYFLSSVSSHCVPPPTGQPRHPQLSRVQLGIPLCSRTAFLGLECPPPAPLPLFTYPGTASSLTSSDPSGGLRILHDCAQPAGWRLRGGCVSFISGSPFPIKWANERVCILPRSSLGPGICHHPLHREPHSECVVVG